jgi:hypothetical protein
MHTADMGRQARPYDRRKAAREAFDEIADAMTERGTR